MKKSKPWITDLLVAFAATTLSIVLTFGTSALVDVKNKKKERKLTALMVMSNIESFARGLEEAEGSLAHIDSLAVGLLKLSAEDIAGIGNEAFYARINDVFEIPILRHDRTAETIFSSHIDTWKNLGNFRFIDNVGSCFSSMNWIEEYFNKSTLEFKEEQMRIENNPNGYPGKTMAEKYLLDPAFRGQLLQPHALREWLSYNAAVLRHNNRENMMLIGITEKEVFDFTDARGRDDDASTQEAELEMEDFALPWPDV
jgi:hypothetical protein